MKIYKKDVYKKMIIECINYEEYEKAVELINLIATINDDDFLILDEKELEYLKKNN